MDRNRIGNLSQKHHLIVSRVGAEPRHHYTFTPRHGTHPVVISFYYPHYYHGHPSWTGFRHHENHHEYRRPAYYNYGWSPDWILLLMLHTFLDSDYIDRGGSIRDLDYNGVNETLRDIGNAWISGDIDLIADHLRTGIGIRIYFDGDYQYTTAISDFYAMTADTFSTIRVTETSWGDPVWITPREVYVPGWQRLIDPADEPQTKYIVYRLRRIRSNWYIVAFDSSDREIRCPYQDFRQ